MSRLIRFAVVTLAALTFMGSQCVSSPLKRPCTSGSQQGWQYRISVDAPWGPCMLKG